MQMPLTANSRLGPYEIKSTLGAGGMGEVYRARDSRLNRDVAIKVLRAEALATAEVKARFEREARALAALNHPNIVSIYEFGVDNGEQYIVSELVEGESLRAVIAGKPVPVRNLVDIGFQIADGLAAAHAAGIVHRDLKPENILVAKNGRVKILDFGLARHRNKTITAARDSDETFVPDGDETRYVTSDGAIIGTAAYMSPEQAVGQETDYRSDQFSLGLILHEMATGKQAFARKSGVETMAAIVQEEPPPIEEKLPAPLKWIIDHCLNKEPEQRYESTRDLSRDLRNLRDHFSEAYSSTGLMAPVSFRAHPARWKVLAGVAAGCLLAGALVAYLLKPSGQNIANYRYKPLASNASTAVWSPDGKAIAYSGKVDGIWQVFLRYLNAPAPVQLTHGVHTAWPMGWSSDRAHLLIAESIDQENTPYDKLYSIATVGGEPEYIMKFECHACDLSRDGKVLATLLKRSDGSYSVAISDPVGSPLKDYKPDPFASKSLYNRSGLAFSADGKNILLSRTGDKGAYEMWNLPYPPGSVAPRRVEHNLNILTGLANGSWMPDDRHIVVSFYSDSDRTHLAMVDIQAEGFRQLTAGTSSESEPIPSPDGKHLVYTRDSTRAEVVSVSLEDGLMRTIVSTSGMESDPAWAANEPRLAWQSDRSGQTEMWVRMPDGSERPIVTLADGPPGAAALYKPLLSPDGKRVAYWAWNGKGLWLWLSSLSGGAPVKLTNAENEFEYGGSWSPDGSRFAYLQIHDGRFSLMTVRTTGNAKPVLLRDNVERFLPDWSPAGDWITYRDSKGWNLVSPDGKFTKFLAKMETPYLVFSKDGKTLYGIQTAETEAEPHRATLFALDVISLRRRDIRELGEDAAPASSNYPGVSFSLAPDGKSLVYSTIKEQHDLWMLTGYRLPGFWNRVKDALGIGASK